MALIELNDVEIFEKPSEALDSDVSKYVRTGARRPRYYKNNYGPFVLNDTIDIVVKKNGVEVDTIRYAIKAETRDGYEVLMPLTVDFVETVEQVKDVAEPK